MTSAALLSGLESLSVISPAGHRAQILASCGWRSLGLTPSAISIRQQTIPCLWECRLIFLVKTPEGAKHHGRLLGATMGISFHRSISIQAVPARHRTGSWAIGTSGLAVFLAEWFKTPLWLTKTTLAVFLLGALRNSPLISCMKMLRSLRALCRAGRRNKRCR